MSRYWDPDFLSLQYSRRDNTRSIKGRKPRKDHEPYVQEPVVGCKSLPQHHTRILSGHDHGDGSELVGLLPGANQRRVLKGDSGHVQKSILPYM